MTFSEDAVEGQHIVISGGCGGIGLGVVKKLTDHGAVMTVNDIIEPGEAQARLRKADVNLERVIYVQGDMTRSADQNALIEAAFNAFGPIQTALCHAGMVISGPLLEYAESDWDNLMNLNLKSAFLLGQAAARAMTEHNVAGHLIFTSSWVSETPWPEIGPYNASKAAMNQLM